MPFPPFITASPTSINFGNVLELTSSPSMSITFSNGPFNSAATFTINPVDPRYVATPSGTFTLASGQSQVINFVFNATTVLGASSTLFFTGPIAGPPSLFANTIAGGSVAWTTTPNPFDFGSLKVGANNAQLFTVTNNSLTLPLVINAITANQSEFSLTGVPSLPATIAVGGNITFTITCTAALRGNVNYPNGVTITPSAGAAIDLDLSYEGFAITPVYILTGATQGVLFGRSGFWNGTQFTSIVQSLASLPCEVAASLVKMIDFQNPSYLDYMNRLYMRLDPLGTVQVGVSDVGIVSEEMTFSSDTKTRLAQAFDALNIPDFLWFDFEQNSEVHRITIAVGPNQGILSIQQLIPAAEPRGSTYEGT